MFAQLILSVAFAASFAQAPPQGKTADLRISDVLFEDYNGALSARWEMKPGEEVLLHFRIEGFKRLPGQDADGRQADAVKLHYRIQLKDPRGVPVAAEETGNIETILGYQDAEWRPKVNWSARVPAAAPVGAYTVEVKVSDEVANREAEKSVSFRVLGRSVPPADHLQITQLEYSDSDRGPWSEERYFSPAETIWVQYKVVGFRVSPDRQVWVEQDWTVLDSDGKVVASTPQALIEKEQSFYPPSFLPAIFTLSLNSPKPGKYTLRVDLHDRVGEQNATMDSDFFLRP